MMDWNRTAGAALLSLCALAAQAADFKACDDAASDHALSGSLCAQEAVPGDPSGLAGAPVSPLSLFVRKFPADGPRRGQVWLVAGGPGESGASFYAMLPTLRKAFPGFDLLLPDHRGTGFSSRMCPAEEAVGSPGGMALDGAEWGTCFKYLNKHPVHTRRFSLTNAAHDLKQLVDSTPREGKTFVYGVSYGTQLVLRAVAMGLQADGLVLDSLVPLQDDERADLSRRSLVADTLGRHLLADCDARQRCRKSMGEPLEPLYRRVLARAGQDPAWLAAVPGKNLKQFFGSLLDFPSAADGLPGVIKALDAGDDKPLRAVVADVRKQVATFGTFAQLPASTPLVILISGSENNLQPGRTLDAVKAEEAGLLFASALPAHLVGSVLPLYARDAWFGRVPERMPPTLVVHGARDAKTPYSAALRHIDVLRRAGPVALHVGEEDGHFLLWAGQGCVTGEIMQFVLGADAPTRCVAISSRD